MQDIDIVLASGSPRRRELLEGLGWRFSVIVPNVDESVLPGEAPEELCVRLAKMKAAAVSANVGTGSRKDSLVIAADTIVLVDGEVLGKPRDREDSLWMLRRLQGRAHEVLTGIALFWDTRSLTELERTEVYFRSLDDAALQAYADTGEGMDKAGAYAVQGKGSLLVASLSGDYFNVVGLPLCRLSRMIEQMGLNLSRHLGVNF